MPTILKWNWKSENEKERNFVNQKRYWFPYICACMNVCFCVLSRPVLFPSRGLGLGLLSSEFKIDQVNVIRVLAFEFLRNVYFLSCEN